MDVQRRGSRLWVLLSRLRPPVMEGYLAAVRHRLKSVPAVVGSAASSKAATRRRCRGVSDGAKHFGAPTRLLDFTYSFFVATLFALEGAFRMDAGDTTSVEILCINCDWCWEAAEMVEPRLKPCNHLSTGEKDNTPLRDDDSFQPIYMQAPCRRFGTAESPYSLNPRATIQQGAYLCPGDVTVSLEDNIRALDGSSSENALVRIRLTTTREERQLVLKELFRMNVTRATLFPGLDGFASSLKHRMAFGPDAM